jgi:hypothetical protein
LRSSLSRKPFGDSAFRMLTIVAGFVLSLSACAAHPASTGIVAPERRYTRLVTLSYRKFKFVSPDGPPPHWSLILMPDGHAVIHAHDAGMADGQSQGLVSEPLRSRLDTELQRLASLPVPTICGGHFDTFEVVDLNRDLTSIECLPMRPGSELAALWALVEQMIKTTQWQSTP